ncbi:hypothetical protein ACMATS_04690 [Streptoverticillium reticulum]|uniref:hypothetical protein n=1 Tax=Streptoverticillium reticulum TaxID=1433415 RepID=UPI0039BFC00E
MRRRITGGLVAGLALAGALFGAVPSAQAATAGAPNLNCVNEYIGFNNGQPFYHVQCGVIGQATWYANAACSDGSFQNAGPMTNFREVWVYCPAGTEVKRGWVTSY